MCYQSRTQTLDKDIFILEKTQAQAKLKLKQSYEQHNQ